MKRRQLITGKIRGQTGLPPQFAELPSAHLRWALQQMKTRGWRNDDWGRLLEPDSDKLGDGPICLLEAVHTGLDAPGSPEFEGPEQFYLRRAFVALGWEPALYLSEWNDAQETFEPVETLLNKAIELAEKDERAGRKPYLGRRREELLGLYGITQKMLDEARRRARDAAGTAD